MTHHERDEQNLLYLPNDPFKGSFAELLPLVKQYPGLVEPSKARLHRLIVRQGSDELRSAEIQRIYDKEALHAYKAFEPFFGVEPAIHRIVSGYLGAAMAGAEADKQALVLIGPPGAGKSDQVQLIKEIYRSCEPIPRLEGSPVNDNPMSLLFMVHTVARERVLKQGAGEGRTFQEAVLAEATRIVESLNLADLIGDGFSDPKVAEILAKHGAEGTDAESLAKVASANAGDFVSVVCYGMGLPRVTRNNLGMPDPWSRARLLGNPISGKSSDPVDIADFPVDSMFFDMDDQSNTGIVDVPEVQPLNFDIGTWIGEEDLGRMGMVDSDDPSSIKLNGAFDRGNRGIVILTEGLKNPPEAQRVLLEALQGRRVAIPQPLGGSLHWEGLVIIHSNEGEYEKFLGDRVNEPYWDRFYRVFVPYPLEASEATKISQKLWNQSDYSNERSERNTHVEPLLFEYESRLRVLSYLEDDENGIPLMTKLRSYDGKQIRDKRMGTVIDVRDLRERSTWREGMEGISPRESAKTIGELASEMQGRGNCVTSRAFRDRVIELLKTNVRDDKLRERYQGFLAQDLEEWRRKQLGRMVRAAFIPEFKDECQKVFDKYQDWSSCFARGVTPKLTGYSRVGQRELEDFLREIESDPDWGVTEAQAPRFRQEVMSAVTDWVREKGNTKVPYTCHEGIKHCVERFVLKQMKDVVRIFSTQSARSTEDKKKLEGVMQRLIDDHGFCKHCAEQLLIEVEMNRNFLVER